jgi:ATP synthase protein I
MAGDARDEDDHGPRPAEEAALSARLRQLGERLESADSSRTSGAGPVDRGAVDASAFARGLRLSSEFVAGVVAGAGLGWLLDHWLGTSPWGLIVLTMLGFAASVLTLIRASSRDSGNLPDGRADRRQN